MADPETATRYDTTIECGGAAAACNLAAGCVTMTSCTRVENFGLAGKSKRQNDAATITRKIFTNIEPDAQAMSNDPVKIERMRSYFYCAVLKIFQSVVCKYINLLSELHKILYSNGPRRISALLINKH